MNRYVAVSGLSTQVSFSDVEVEHHLVVDLTNGAVVADCGSISSLATKVAQALNNLDGGPLS